MGNALDRNRRAWASLHGIAAGIAAVCMGLLADPAVSQEAANDEQIKIDAAKMDFNRQTGIASAQGNAIIRRGDVELHADQITYDSRTEEVHAIGHVLLRRPGGDWRGNELHYNFKTQEGDAPGLIGGAEPFHLVAEKASRGPAGTIVLQNASVSTCSNECSRWHYHVKASELILTPGESIKGRGTVFYFGRVPLFYAPYWWRALDDEFGWTFYPGYNSRMGAFLLSSYGFRVNPALKSRTHIDYRTRRGAAVGEDLDWRDPVANRWNGGLSVYYANDRNPLDDDEDPETSDIESSRYRVRLKHEWSMTDRDYMLMQGNYLSDTDVLEDFFEDEYRLERQPENYLTYTHRGEDYTLNALLYGRLNDFYSTVNRLPEVALDLSRRQLGESEFYYEGQTAAAFLQRAWEKQGTSREDYSSLRFDTEHTIYHPGRYFGFLNVLPRVGYRGTFYSDSLETETSTETTTTLTTNFVVTASGATNAVVNSSTATNSVSRDVGQGADFRNLLEFGVEVSFKAFKMWEGGIVSPLRHIVEPYLNYTFVPEPTVLPENLYQFDRVDTLGKEHWTKLGVRNKFQTKRDGRPYDLIDLDTYTVVFFERDPGESAIQNLYVDAELRPTEHTAIDLDAIVNLDESTIDRFNAQFWLKRRTFWQADAEYRYRRDASSLLQGDLTLYPSRRWAYNAYGRYEFEQGGRLEEVGTGVSRTWDCMVVRTGLGVMPGYTRPDGYEVDDEWRVLVEFWLTAFPQMSLGNRHRH